jgi:hypothetical protein
MVDLESSRIAQTGILSYKSFTDFVKHLFDFTVGLYN